MVLVATRAPLMASTGHETTPGSALSGGGEPGGLDNEWTIGAENGSDAGLERSPKSAKSPANAGLFWKRLMGFEPTTFCMASRRSSQLSYSRRVA